MNRVCLQRLLIVLLLVHLPVAGAGAQAKPEPIDAAIQRLQRSVTVQRDGGHLELLASLRSLGDPALAPFFSRLTSHDDALVQINGMLGLAEISPERRIDPWLISRLATEAARLQAINLAIGLDLIGLEQMRTLLAAEHLEDTSRIALLAELVSRDEAVDRARLEALAASKSQKVRAVAAMLLTHVTGDRSFFEKMQSELGGLTEREQHNARMWLASDAGEYRLTGMLWWLEQLLTSPDVPDDLAMLVLRSAFLLDAARGAELWRASLERSPSAQRRLAYGLLLLDVLREVEVPAELFDAIRDGEELAERIADAGAAMAGSRESAVEPLLALLRLDHPRAASDVLACARLLPAEQAAAIDAAIIERVAEEGIDPAIVALREELAVRAVPSLIEHDQQRLLGLLQGAADDSRMQEIILVGLLGSADPAAGEMAAGLPRIGFGRADSLAMLLIAKHAPAGNVTPTDLLDLGMIAAGGGRLAPSLEVEAAWLYVKHTGKVELAMSRLFAPADGG